MPQSATLAKKPRSKSRKRYLMLHIRVTPNERDQIRQVACSRNVSMGELLRSTALGQEIIPSKKPLPSPERQSLSRLLAELGKIGSNLNQLARQANMGRPVQVPESLVMAVLTMTRLANRLTRVLR